MKRICPTAQEKDVLILGDMFDKENINFEHSDFYKNGENTASSGDVLKNICERVDSLSNELATLKLFVNEKFDYLFNTLNLVMEKVGIVRMEDVGDKVSLRFEFFFCVILNRNLMYSFFK